ncbi:MAG: hypothetical protein OHK93_007422 [Ramalina farinacea]|uniref:BTB domain-containing protein n=1 Tax=Ramalina farinacea TaxID=258253 RepID=A0AA43TU19_9LECA|nr:hypothetical protein [Ramalina farinacea]
MDVTDVVSIGGLGVVTVFIGLNKTPYTVHCEFLCRASSYFNDQIPPEHRLTTNGLEYAISKVDEDPKIADIFFLWIYTREYSLGSDVSEVPLPDACITQALRLYCFAVKLGVPDLSLRVLEELFGLMQKQRIQLKYSHLELVWEDEYTDCRLQTLVLLYIAYAPGALSYDQIDIYNWLRNHGSIAVDLLFMQKERYTNPNAGNPFDQSFPYKTFGENAPKEKAHEREGGQSNKHSQHQVQRKDNRPAGDKVTGAERNNANKKRKNNSKGGNDPQSRQKPVDQQTQGVSVNGNGLEITGNEKTQDTAVGDSSNQSANGPNGNDQHADEQKSGDVPNGNYQHADAQKTGEPSGNKRKVEVASSNDTSASKKARKRSDDVGGNKDGATPESSHKDLRRNPARRTVGDLRPYRGKV